MPETPAPTLSLALRERITEAAARWVELPLLAGVRAGTLPSEVFRHYLEQDFLYLRYYARIYARLAASSTDDEELEHFVTLAHGVLAVELDHHRSAAAPFACDFAAVRPSPQLSAYLDFYEEHAGDRAATLVAMLPCVYGYGVALSRLRDADVPGHYGAWIDIYAGTDYGAIMDRHFAMIDTADIPVERALAIAERGLALEIDFWNQVPADAEHEEARA
jgi:thiaminase (transcriptional activator TenA)